MSVAADKQMYRARFKKYAAAMTAAERGAADLAIEKGMCALIRRVKPKTVFCYVSVGDETDTSKILRFLFDSGITVAVPLCHSRGIMEARIIQSPDELIPGGKFGLPEPIASAPRLEPDGVDLAVVPGAAFGEDGTRLGRGGGYYDRWLLRGNAVKCGICREKFLVPSLPTEAHDVKMDFVLTERRLISILPSPIFAEAKIYGGKNG